MIRISPIAYLLLLMTIKASSQSSKAIANDEKGIKFDQRLDWSQILNKAKAENKYIFVDCYATWCGPCKRMDREVYPNDSVENALKDNFIAIKLQMDSTQRDNEHIKSWYENARKLKEKYKIDGLPCFLFFSPDGKLVYKDVGYKRPIDFIKLVAQSLAPDNLLYYAQIEAFKNGEKNFSKMRNLALFAKKILADDTLAKQIAKNYITSLSEEQLLSHDNILIINDIVGDKKLANSLAKKYKNVYLDNLSEEKLCTAENIDFLEKFRELITTQDLIFRLCYTQPEKIDQIKKSEGWSEYMVSRIIAKDEIDNKLLKNSTPLPPPDWDKILLTISKKYERVDASRLILDYQIRFYRNIVEDWRQWAKYKNKKIKAYPPKTGGLEVYTQLNMTGAWDVFLHCNDKSVLTYALAWIDLAIQLEDNHDYLDTKANLLYKLGRVDEAISVQKKAISMAKNLAKKEQSKAHSDQSIAFSKVLSKMKRREPTYLEEGAIWNTSTLPHQKKR